VKSLKPAKHHAAGVVVEQSVKAAPVLHREPESKLWKNIRGGEIFVCVEIDPPKGIALDRIFEQVDKSWRRGKWTRLISIPARWRAWEWMR